MLMAGLFVVELFRKVTPICFRASSAVYCRFWIECGQDGEIDVWRRDGSEGIDENSLVYGRR